MPHSRGKAKEQVHRDQYKMYRHSEKHCLFGSAAKSTADAVVNRYKQQYYPAGMPVTVHKAEKQICCGN